MTDIHIRMTPPAGSPGRAMCCGTAMSSLTSSPAPRSFGARPRSSVARLLCKPRRISPAPRHSRLSHFRTSRGRSASASGRGSPAHSAADRRASQTMGAVRRHACAVTATGAQDRSAPRQIGPRGRGDALIDRRSASRKCHRRATYIRRRGIFVRLSAGDAQCRSVHSDERGKGRGGLAAKLSQWQWVVSTASPSNANWIAPHRQWPLVICLLLTGPAWGRALMTLSTKASCLLAVSERQLRARQLSQAMARIARQERAIGC